MVSLMELLQLSFKPSEVPGEFGFVRFLSRGSIEMGSQGPHKDLRADSPFPCSVPDHPHLSKTHELFRLRPEVDVPSEVFL